MSLLPSLIDIAHALTHACTHGCTDGVFRLLARDLVLYSDGLKELDDTRTFLLKLENRTDCYKVGFDWAMNNLTRTLKEQLEALQAKDAAARGALVD